MSRSSNSATLRNALVWSAAATAAIAVIGSAIGFFVAGMPGVYSALLGAVMAALFMGLTLVIMMIAGRFQGPEQLAQYFGVAIGGWAVKLVVFIVVMYLLLGVSWLHGYVFFFVVLVSVIASLVVDMMALAKTRVDYEGHDVLPLEDLPESGQEAGSAR